MAQNPEELYTVERLAANLSVSEHHLKKIIQKLAKTDYINSAKGRTGGLKLGLSPEEISLGDVLSLTEENLNIVECFQTETACRLLDKECKLKAIVQQSLEQFIAEFRKYTLQDLI